MTFRRVSWLVWVVLGIANLLPGCTSPERDPRLKHLAIPPDFTLFFQVVGDSSPNSDPLRQSSQYMLQADRRLHLTQAQSAGHHMSGSTSTVIISPEAYEDLARHVLDNQLMYEPTSPAAAAADQTSVSGGKPTIIYRVECTVRGRTHHYATTPADSPPTVQLLAKLVLLRSSPSY